LQAAELRTYFKALGADISSEVSSKGVEDDLRQIIDNCDACFNRYDRRLFEDQGPKVGFAT